MPGSKNTIGDLLHLKETGLAAAIAKYAATKPVIGICGGYQMMGKEICDPYKSETDLERIDGLNLLPTATNFAAAKFTAQAVGSCRNFSFLGEQITASNLPGYEIHAGITTLPNDGENAPFAISYADGKTRPEGAQAGENGQIFGTYLHGIFDDDKFRRDFLNALRKTKNLPPWPVTENVAAQKEQSYNRLADILRRSLDIDGIKKIMRGQGGAP